MVNGVPFEKEVLKKFKDTGIFATVTDPIYRQPQRVNIYCL